jgi:hypothetical protein
MSGRATTCANGSATCRIGSASSPPDTGEAFSSLEALVADHENVTLVYSAKDEEHNQAVVLRDVLQSA